LQYVVYFLASVNEVQLLGYPSPFRPDDVIVPIVRYLIWYNTLPAMCGVLLCLGNSNSREIAVVMLSGTMCIAFGWVGVGYTFTTYRWTAMVFFVVLAEVCLLVTCSKLYGLMLRTTELLATKSSQLTMTIQTLPSTSSLVRISIGVIITWHTFPVLVVFADYWDVIFPGVNMPLLNAVIYACIDMLNKACVTFAIMMSSFIVGEVASSLIELENQVQFDLKVKMEEAFVAFVFHEMRNPFNGMAGHIECAESSFINLRKSIAAKDESQTQDLLKEIGSDLVALNSCKAHMSSILNRALDLVRAEVGLGIVSKTMVLEDIMGDVLRLTGDSRVRVRYVDNRSSEDKKVNPGPLRCIGDGLRLKQVLLNLCSNALNHTELGEHEFVELEAVVASMSAGDNDGDDGNDSSKLIATFTITDTGCGIPEGDIANIFSRMFSTRVTKGGIGLGLTISQRLVMAMSEGKSKIAVTSPWPPEGKGGSRFSFDLCMEVAKPVLLTNDELEEVTRKAKEALVLGSEMDESKQLPLNVRVLVVDDMVMNRKIISRKLTSLKPFSELGWTFEQAKTGEECLEIMEKHGGPSSFDVIWMDEILSSAGGILLGSDTIAMIRAKEKEKGVKGAVIVSSTGNTTEKDCAKYKAAGADFVAGKPTPSAVELAELFLVHFEKRGMMRRKFREE
jgi:signal transduction histidine kinase/CheY-like chemotaxis protein